MAKLTDRFDPWSPANGGRGTLRRIMALIRPHRRTMIIGIVSAVLAAAFQAASLTGLMPILNIMVEREGLHAWVDRNVASERLGAEVSLYDSRNDPPLNAGVARPVMIRQLKDDSPLAGSGVRNTDAIVTCDSRALDGAELLQAINEAPPDTTIQLGVISARGESEQITNHSIKLRAAGARWQATRAAVAWIRRPDPGQSPMRPMIYVVVVVGIIATLGSAFRFVAEYQTARAILRSVMDLRRKLYGRVLRLPMSFFTHEVSDTVSRFIQDSEEIQRGLQTLFVRMVREPAKAIFLFFAALFIDWRLTLTVVAAAPWIIVIFWAVGRKVRKANKQLLQGWGSMVGALETTLRGVAVVKAYHAEHTERLRLWRIDRQMFRNQMKLAFLDALIGPAMEVLTLVAGSLGLLWLASEVLSNHLEPGRFLMLGILLAMMFDPLRKSANVYNRVQRARAAGERIFAVIDAPIEPEPAHGAVTLSPLSDRVEFRDVVFTYPGAERPALNHVNFELRKGETVAVVGPNGSGKTTLISQLLRFYDPQSGQVLFDGVDIRQATLSSLRRQISLVTQEPGIFAVSMSENIAYGTRGRTRVDVENAARHAFADEFIRTMTDGYDTVAGDYGRTMSGGQRQRVAIARAVLKNAPILIFDEATSQVDSESEQKIQAALRELTRGRTTIIIAHRLSTIQFAHRIVLMDQGRITDTGTHDKLFQRSVLYRTLCQTQFVALGESQS